MHPEYRFSLKSPRRTISKLVCFHTINWVINCAKKIVQGECKSPWSSKYLSCCSLMVVLAELADFELEGWYAMTILVFLLPDPTFSQHQWPRPEGLTPDSITSAEKRPIAIIPHPPCWFCCIRSFILWATMLQVSMPMPIIFLNCCSSVAWGQSAWVLHPAKILVLNWPQSLFKLLIFVPLVKSPKLLKFSIITQTQLSGFSQGAFSYAGSWKKSSICQDTWFWACCLCKKIWYADVASWEQLWQRWVEGLSLWIAVINWEANGCMRAWKDLVPVSNCADCTWNLRAASELVQQLPRWEFRSREEVLLRQYLLNLRSTLRSM